VYFCLVQVKNLRGGRKVQSKAIFWTQKYLTVRGVASAVALQMPVTSVRRLQMQGAHPHLLCLELLPKILIIKIIKNYCMPYFKYNYTVYWAANLVYRDSLDSREALQLLSFEYLNRKVGPNLFWFSSYPHHFTILQPNKTFPAPKIRILVINLKKKLL
jgi:hypothetical protein